MHPPAPDYTIVVINWNTKEQLGRCLTSVQLELKSQHGWQSQVIVMDNASTDGSQAMVRSDFPWVELIENNENIGFARAVNQALSSGQADFYLLLNSDTELKPGVIRELQSCLNNDDRAGAAGPLVLNPDGTMQHSYGALPTVVAEIIGPYRFDFITKPWGGLGRLIFRQAIDQCSCKQVERVSFACTLIRREALEQVGLLDERYEFYSEDYDWFFRLRAAGWLALFCPGASVVHHWGMSSSQRSEWAASQLYRSKRLYYAKHYGTTTEFILRFGLGLRFLLKIFVALVSYPVSCGKSVSELKLNQRLFRQMMRRVGD